MWNVLKQHYGIYYGGYKLSLQMRHWLLTGEVVERGVKEGRMDKRGGNRECKREKGQMEEKTAPCQTPID